MKDQAEKIITKIKHHWIGLLLVFNIAYLIVIITALGNLFVNS